MSTTLIIVGLMIALGASETYIQAAGVAILLCGQGLSELNKIYGD